jgi:hypothetical protein
MNKLFATLHNAIMADEIPIDDVPKTVAKLSPAQSVMTAPAMFGGPEPVDAETLTTLMNVVMPDNKTAYAKFLKMWNALNHPTDVNQVISALQAVDETITVQAVLNSIQDHLTRLDNAGQQATKEIDSAAQQTLGNLQTEVAQRTDANTAAAQEIARHQQETITRTAEIADLNQQIATYTAKVQRAKSNEAAAEATIRTQLTQAQSALK